MHTTTQLTFRFHWSEEKINQVVLNNSVLVMSYQTKKKKKSQRKGASFKLSMHQLHTDV